MDHKEIVINTTRKGFYDLMDYIEVFLESQVGKDSEGLLNVYVRHTSCSLNISENWDEDVKKDLEKWFDENVPEDGSYKHMHEGLDDMPAHIKAILNKTSITIPVIKGEMVLGKWQGVSLWEHRNDGAPRKIILSFIKG